MIPIGQTEIVQRTLKDVRARGAGDADARLKDVAQKLETSFLAEMLKHAGVGEARGAFGGGAGEDQFASFLRQAQEGQMAASGGIGLAEQLFESLKERQNGPV